MIKFHCSNCNQKIGLADDYAGKMVRCAKCSQPTRVPKVSEEASQEKSAHIRFHCPKCNQKLKVPQGYAGKQVKCAKCGQPARVPELSKEPSQEKSAHISFHCPKCNQKLKVPRAYAGKRVKCTKCSYVVEVPGPGQEAAQKQLVTDKIGDDKRLEKDIGGGEMFGGDISADELLAAEAGAPAAAGELRFKPLAPEPAESQSQVFATGMQSTSYSGDEGDGGGFAKSAGRIPLALLTSLACSVVGAIVWTWVSSLFGVMWFGFVDILVIPVIAVAGFGLGLFLDSRNVGLGLLAALIGLTGGISGKVFIAKWVIMPEMEKMFTEGFFQNPIYGRAIPEDFDIRKGLSSDEQSEQLLANLVKSKNSMFLLASMQLVDEGEFEEAFALQVASANVSGGAAIESTEEIKAAHAKVQKLLDGLSADEKKKIAREQFSKLVERAFKMFMESGFGLALVFIGTFSLWDLLWFPMGLWSAYKIGAGRE
ncbi:MAG: hypothetical protein ACYS1A_03340 [Planctomycetota bacterium]|jgi:hypothetical protein